MRGVAAIACLLGGCGWLFQLDRLDEIDAGDGGGVDGSSIPSHLCSYGQPQQLPGFTSDSYDPSQRPDKRELYFTRAGTGNFELWVASRDTTSEPYASMTAVDSLNTPFNETDSALVSNGLRLFFVSDRSGTRQVYEARRNSLAEGFAAPLLVATGGTSIKGFDMSPDGRTLYYDDGAGNLFQITRADDTGEFGGMQQIASNTGEFPSVPADALTVYYNRGGQVYRQTRVETQYKFAAENEITTGGDADISEDGRTLVFANGTGLAQIDCQ